MRQLGHDGANDFGNFMFGEGTVHVEGIAYLRAGVEVHRAPLAHGDLRHRDNEGGDTGTLVFCVFRDIFENNIGWLMTIEKAYKLANSDLVGVVTNRLS